ncbi:SDR family NAD(P)-dependent oxidoreductase [Sphingomonas aliaeris]|uniref:SDR family NAD(P)-dependent oxidoreductase n=1 Tax=Sphingomonas aliaeris TaxID=2759526 RepID=A0A974NV96_9SPHN|nr:SDR family NAD(P)-dependent oxidoreductase [Sphingomonas aliaeris]QQV77659.1 SDR family NAD(P)-dependent oxidoreductase [Sphingomonas aliaeris]
MARILVVGGAGGVGSAVVRQRIAAGDAVSATVLNDAEASKVAAVHGTSVATHRLDLSHPDSVVAGLQPALASGIDAIVVCVAVSPYGPSETTPLDVYRRTMDINLLSAAAIYQAAMPALRASQGRLVYITSMAGKAAMPFIGPYAASKFALEGLGDVMRREAAPQGVKISMIEPGGIKTPMMEEQLASIDSRIAGLSAEESERYGALYRQFKMLSAEAYVQGASSADEVAESVGAALDDAQPKARYIVGAGAEQLIGMARTLSDAELDGAFAQMYAAVDA